MNLNLKFSGCDKHAKIAKIKYKLSTNQFRIQKSNHFKVTIVLNYNLLIINNKRLNKIATINS